MKRGYAGLVGLMGLGAVILTGCQATTGRAAKSANELGCSADEIQISESAPREGWPERGERWTAECRGRIYECTQAYPEADGDPLKLVMQEQVLCQQVADSPQEVANREAYEDAKARAAAHRSQVAPQGAAGFDFGLSAEQSQQRCEAAKRVWTSDGAAGTCSGPAADIGLDAKVAVSFCDGAACGITVEQEPVDAWAKRSVSLKQRLESKYGPAQNITGKIPENCRGEAEFAECLRTKALHLSYGWEWSTGETLKLEIGKPAVDQDPALRLVYARPKSSANLSKL